MMYVLHDFSVSDSHPVGVAFGIAWLRSQDLILLFDGDYAVLTHCSEQEQHLLEMIVVHCREK